MATGDLLFADSGERTTLVRRNTMDARNAAAKALAAYLGRVVFVVGGDDPVEFQLNRVLEEWPESFEGLPYPVAVITSATEKHEEHSLTPTPIEDTLDRHCQDSVLWKTGELSVDFQVDFWLTNKPMREAVAARLPDAFAPYEGRTGILLEGPPQYWSSPVRLTLISSERVDTAEAVQLREREYRAMVRAEVDLVHLRGAGRLLPVLTLDGERVPIG